MEKQACRGDFAGAFIFVVLPDGTVYFLTFKIMRIDSEGRYIGKWQIKVPGGCANDPNESEMATLQRELEYEISVGPLQIVSATAIFKRELPSRSGPDKKHTQRFFLVSIQDGELRTEKLTEDEGDEEISPPELIEAGELHKIIFPTHKAPLVEALRHLAKDNPAICDKYRSIIM